MRKLTDLFCFVCFWFEVVIERDYSVISKLNNWKYRLWINFGESDGFSSWGINKWMKLLILEIVYDLLSDFVFHNWIRVNGCIEESISLDTASQKFDFLIELKVYSSRSSIAFFLMFNCFWRCFVIALNTLIFDWNWRLIAVVLLSLCCFMFIFDRSESQILMHSPQAELIINWRLFPINLFDEYLSVTVMVFHLGGIIFDWRDSVNLFCRV